MRTMSLALCTFLLCLGALWLPTPARALADPGAGGSSAAAGAGTSAAARDYQTVRKVAMALAVIGFLIAVKQLATSEFPSERHRAESLLTLTLFVFLFLAGDRMIVQGASGWFNFPMTALPAFWQ